MSITMDVDSLIAAADREYPALYQLLAGYFHEDWRDDAPTTDAVVRGYVVDAPPAAVQATRADLDRLLARRLSEPDLSRLLSDGFGCDYAPEADGIAPSRWLAELRDRLDSA
jgi:hypothetical protein